MINVRLRSEYSFRKAFGPIHKVVETTEGDVMGISDSGTWGHVAFSKACKKAGKKPLFGVEIPIVEDATERSKQPTNEMTFIAKNNDGLRELYQLVTKSTDKDHFYYHPRLSYEHLFDISKNIIILTGTHPILGLLPLAKKEDMYFELNPMTTKNNFNWAKEKGFNFVATSDNYYPKPEDKKAYEVLVGRNRQDRTAPMHILNEWEWKDLVPWAPEKAIENTYKIAEMCNAELPIGKMISFKPEKTLRQMCEEGAIKRKINCLKSSTKGFKHAKI